MKGLIACTIFRSLDEFDEFAEMEFISLDEIEDCDGLGKSPELFLLLFELILLELSDKSRSPSCHETSLGEFVMHGLLEFFLDLLRILLLVVLLAAMIWADVRRSDVEFAMTIFFQYRLL